MARPRRFERLTPAFGGLYSIQLSYERICQRELFYPFPIKFQYRLGQSHEKRDVCRPLFFIG